MVARFTQDLWEAFRILSGQFSGSHPPAVEGVLTASDFGLCLPLDHRGSIRSGEGPGV